MPKTESVLSTVVTGHHAALLSGWLENQRRDGAVRTSDDTTRLATQFLELFRNALSAGQFDDIDADEWALVRDMLETMSRGRALEGYSPTETATFVFALKQPLFALLREQLGADADRLSEEIWTATKLLDKLGLFTTESFQRTREEVIGRQQQELLELSTPVVKLWDGVLAVPLIGTLDSARTQLVMESLLEAIVASEAEVAIIDITGVPTVDTLVAQHLLKAISAARLMGADCIISGIRPQIAQTIVHLGLDLNVVSKATLADAFALALRRTGRAVTARVAAPPPPGE
jgi:rsbT co-antagonist protein RsbR